MKEQELIDLGFKRTDVSAEESGDKAFYYYDIDLGSNGSISLISPSDDEVENGNWYVEVFEDAKVMFTDKDDLKVFIDIINKNTLRDDSI